MPVRSRPDVVFMSRWFDDDTRGVDGRDTCSRGPVAELDDDERVLTRSRGADTELDDDREGVETRSRGADELLPLCPDRG